VTVILHPRFDSLLVANRGEIAQRIIRSAAGLGLRTVAVYSDADADSRHVRMADSAVRIGPPPAAQSYLSIGAIIEAAVRSGAGAIHPGYGFLGERAEFARACEQAGIVFVGPRAATIELMGRKDSARHVAVAAKVPVVPAVEGADPGDLAALALEHVGLPLLVKAAAGGGGKGMRVVTEAGGLREAIEASKREALASFGDDTVLIERYVERGKHIEVQILADEHKNVVHLFERDCSTQRRHQKVIEEAPASSVSAVARELVRRSAVQLAKRAGYVNAGTVEFLVDGDNVYLLEMNTRLQVEHPVTEMVTGRDLVELQLRIAQGEPLPFTQQDLHLNGHAIEARVYAEDADAGFLPQAGTAVAVRWPRGARIDGALESGQSVSTLYDPMLAKVIVHGETREAARASLVRALAESVVFGLRTNLSFLGRVLESEAFRESAIDTAWLDRRSDALPRGEAGVAWPIAAWRFATDSGEPEGSPFGVRDGWRLAAESTGTRVDLVLGAERRRFAVDAAIGTVRCGQSRWTVRPVSRTHDETGLVDHVVEVDGQRYTATSLLTAHGVFLRLGRDSFSFTAPVQASHVDDHGGDSSVLAPMPGVLTSVRVAAGQQVEPGSILGSLEAMKMEHLLRAPLGGVVSTVPSNEGAQVQLGQVLFVVEPAAVAD
jgi:acetyl-CoA/propionyl-CoA carboxylase biotin carboxyl carrier protein